MNLLFYIKPAIFWPLRTKVSQAERGDPAVEQDSPALNDVRMGQSVWVFSRRPEDDTYLLDSRIIVRFIEPSVDREYGWLHVWGTRDESVLFAHESQPDLGPLLRELSIPTNARVLGQSFQGHNAVRRLSEEDHQRLLAWSRRLRVVPPR